MLNKTLEALVSGVVIWVAGASVIVLLGQVSLFPKLAVPVAFLTAPAMYLITRFHLRNVSAEERTYVAIRLGIIVTAVQFPLDALGLLIIFRFGYPPLSSTALEALILALDVGYFWLLVVPWWVGRVSKRNEG